MGVYLQPADLPPNTGKAIGLSADVMIADAEAMAALVAPCLATLEDLTPAQVAAVKAVLRGVIMRWNDAGSGAVQSESAGPFSHTIDTTVTRKGMFWPSEISQLQSICADGNSGKAFVVDTVPTGGGHSDVCALRFGAAYCDCGTDIAGHPIYGPGLEIPGAGVYAGYGPEV